MSNQSFNIKPFKRFKLKSWSTLAAALVCGVINAAIATLPGSNISVSFGLINGILIVSALSLFQWLEHKNLSDTHTLRVSERGLVFQDDEKIARVPWSSITSVTLLSSERASEEKLLWMHINDVVRIEFVDYEKPAQLIEAVKKYLPSEKIRTGKRALFANHHTVLYQNHWGKTKTPRSLLNDDKEDS